MDAPRLLPLPAKEVPYGPRARTASFRLTTCWWARRSGAFSSGPPPPVAGLRWDSGWPRPQTPFAHTQVNPLSGYLTIAPEGLVVVHSAHMDMGQGSYHGLATLVAEELDADWSQIRADGAWGNTKLYGNLVWGGAMQGTGGSTAISSSFDRYRQAGAAAREMLIAAASTRAAQM